MSVFNNPFIFGSVGETGLGTAQSVNDYANTLAGSELAGLNSLLSMQNSYNAFGSALDLEYLGLRQDTGQFLRGVENSVFDAMTQEKLENLNFELDFNIAQNRFNLAKTVVNSAKY